MTVCQEVGMNLFDVCIVGAGPAGITVAMELAERGLAVALVESGDESIAPSAQRLSDAEIVTPDSHEVMEDAVRRGLGGTSALWGGRCVPLDSIDFENRDFINGSGWPLSASDLAQYYPRACEILGVGDAAFEVDACRTLATHDRLLSSKFVDTETIRATQLERWSHSPNVWLAYKGKIKSYPRISVQSGLTCVGFRQSEMDGSVTEALLQPTLLAQSETKMIKARVFVVACGGVESTRLVLNSIRDPLGLKLKSPQMVGSYYMGHPSGKIADIELFGDPTKTLYGFENDGGVYVRRRITLRPDTLHKEKLLNIAFWLDNAPLQDWRHGSGVLSAAYLALTAPVLGRFLAPAAIRKRVAGEGAISRWRHVLNCLRSPWQTVLFSTGFVYKRYLAKLRLPGFFTYSTTNRYALHYHAEQAPNWVSSISLSAEADAHGLLRAKISLNWSQQDVDSIIKAHSVLDNALQSNNIGRLVYRYADAELQEAIRVQAVDGFHQIGTLRMAANPTDGVTDSFGRLFGAPNVYVSSSAIFPTSGQANPTLTMVALAIRQAEHIAAYFKQRGVDA